MIIKRIMKLYGDSIWKPLEIIFKKWLKEKSQYCTDPQKKIINKSYLIIDQFAFFQFVVRF